MNLADYNNPLEVQCPLIAKDILNTMYKTTLAFQGTTKMETTEATLKSIEQELVPLSPIKQTPKELAEQQLGLPTLKQAFLMGVPIHINPKLPENVLIMQGGARDVIITFTTEEPKQ